MGPWPALDARDNDRDLVRQSSVVGMEVVVWDRVVARSPGAGERGGGGHGVHARETNNHTATWRATVGKTCGLDRTLPSLRNSRRLRAIGEEGNGGKEAHSLEDEND
jgi:hypothetical protein